MNLYKAWENMVEMCQNDQQMAMFWNEYYAAETEIYKKILSEKTFTLQGTVKELAEKFNMEPPVLCGFIDGINTSLKQEIDVKEIEEDTEVTLDIEIEKLYYNMLNAKAKWLYTLNEWDDVLSEEQRKTITKQWRSDNIAVSEKIGRNDPCTCGSGKKYKNCCGNN